MKLRRCLPFLILPPLAAFFTASSSAQTGYRIDYGNRNRFYSSASQWSRRYFKEYSHQRDQNGNDQRARMLLLPITTAGDVPL